MNLTEKQLELLDFMANFEQETGDPTMISPKWSLYRNGFGGDLELRRSVASRLGELRKKGLVLQIPPGIWRLSEEGRAVMGLPEI